MHRKKLVFVAAVLGIFMAAGCASQGAFDELKTNTRKEITGLTVGQDELKENQVGIAADVEKLEKGLTALENEFEQVREKIEAFGRKKDEISKMQKEIQKLQDDL
ncbi:MAG: hypothetical protein KGZ25_10475, partial [Planctomycetes bacterium]|nr:hypothetical protein [Planctomycetota bacterium]